MYEQWSKLASLFYFSYARLDSDEHFVGMLWMLKWTEERYELLNSSFFHAVLDGCVRLFFKYWHSSHFRVSFLEPNKNEVKCSTWQTW
jgi:hypothetical protein